jgi:hypothetical protein
MLFFVATRFHQYTMAALRRTACGGHDVTVVPLAYEELFAAPQLSGGTYVFTDIERLSPLERRLAAEVFRKMRAHPAAFRPINDPARVRHRFALLRALHEAGINSFDAYPAEGLPRPARFPVFLKSCSDHNMMVTGLLPDQAALEAALERVQAAGTPLGDLAVIEYCAEPVRPGVWCRYTAFRVGDAILPDLPVTQDHWTVKAGTTGLVSDETYLEHDRMIRHRPDRLWPRRLRPGRGAPGDLRDQHRAEPGRPRDTASERGAHGNAGADLESADGADRGPGRWARHGRGGRGGNRAAGDLAPP